MKAGVSFQASFLISLIYFAAGIFSVSCNPPMDEIPDGSTAGFQATDTTYEPADSGNVYSEPLLQGDSLATPRRSAKSENKKSPPAIELTRYIEFPGNENFNGKPLTMQLDIQQKLYEKDQDTLVRLAKAYYLSFKPYFPVSIADNFEEGISTEHIHYVPLVFRFELFTDNLAAKPYAVRLVRVSRNEFGELTAE